MSSLIFRDVFQDGENNEAPYSNEESTPQTGPFSREIAAHMRSFAMFRLRHVLIQSGQPLPVLVERLEMGGTSLVICVAMAIC